MLIFIIVLEGVEIRPPAEPGDAEGTLPNLSGNLLR